MRYTILALLLGTDLLFAGDSFMMQWKIQHFGMLFSIGSLIIILPLWIVTSFFTKKSDGFFKTLLWIDLTLFALCGIVMLLSGN